MRGILHNAIYVGRITYGRASFRKDPDTGGRREEWRERRADLGLAKWPRENEDDTAPATVGFRISPVPHAILPSLEPVLDGLLKAELPR